MLLGKCGVEVGERNYKICWNNMEIIRDLYVKGQQIFGIHYKAGYQLFYYKFENRTLVLFIQDTVGL